MPDLLLWIIIFIFGLAVLVKASDYFTDAAEKIGIFFGMPAFIVGVTIVAFGTSLPELVSSIFAVLQGASEIVVGNVVGSNIANIFLILGITAIIAGKKLKISYELVHVDLPILIGSSFLFAAMVWDGSFTLFEAILSIIALGIYIHYTLHTEHGHKDVEIRKEVKGTPRVRKLPITAWFILVISAIFIFVSARITIEAIVEISAIAGIGTEIIAASAVAVGTSLPELVVSIAAARKGKAEIAVGNILGSNIFNTYAVMGIPALFGALIVPASILSFALPVMLAATLLFFFITHEKIITQWEGGLLLIFYVFFLGKLFNFL